MSTTPTPDLLDELHHLVWAVRHHDVAPENAIAKINALMVSRQAIAEALPKSKKATLNNPDNGDSNHSFRLGYNRALADIRAALGMESE